MSGIKVFKDPLYGYIKIPNLYVNEIIDTPAFQRLRRIVQTSYSPLFASSVHNRFTHSIGVYHLGKIAAEKLTKEIMENDRIKGLDNWEHIKDIFLLACLLHDVGHAPFSHTGEKFFLDDSAPKNQYGVLHGELCSLIDRKGFREDVPVEDSKSAAPHEVMSAIIGIQNFSHRLPTPFDKELFARCMTGYKFSGTDTLHNLYNCYIALLNSKVIDVDRLDYLIRDAYFTGFDTVNIDYERLLTHITITDKNSNTEVNDESDDSDEFDDSLPISYRLVYHKGAISVIENFVYAHDSGRKWIQNHPSILYDMYIIQHIISQLNKKLSTEENKLFSQECLSEKGKTLDNGLTMSLLCDDDMISLMKSNNPDDLSKEYFARNNRRHPLWKSEAEYNAFVTSYIDGGLVLTKLKSALKKTEQYLRKNSDGWVINDETIDKIKEEIDKINTEPPQNLRPDTIRKQRESKEQILKVMNCLKVYSQSKGVPCDFVILTAEQFYSGFNKVDFSDIDILFPSKGGAKVRKLQKVIPSLSGSSHSKDNFFYIFYKRCNEEEIDKEEFCTALFHEFTQPL